VFESDFESTDEEEAAGGDEERDSVAERYIQEEEQKMRMVRVSKYHPNVGLTMVTVMLRKLKRSWSVRRLWHISINELLSNLSYIKLLSRERAFPIDDSNQRSSLTQKLER